MVVCAAFWVENRRCLNLWTLVQCNPVLCIAIPRTSGLWCRGIGALQLLGRVLSRRTLIRVELIQADKTDVGALAGLQFAVEACAGIAGEYRVLGVESLDGEQVLRAA